MTEQALHPYNDHDNFEKVAEVYLGGYEWDIACVFREKATGRLYGDRMGGCSCYGPWEQGDHAYYCPDYSGTGDLKDIEHERDAAALLDGLRGEDGEASTEQRRDFVNAVRLALRA